MDIHAEWRHLMGRNAMEIMAFTTDFVRQYWRIVDQPRDSAALDAYRENAMSGDYDWLISASAEFILEQTGVLMPMEYLLREKEDYDDA